MQTSRAYGQVGNKATSAVCTVKFAVRQASHCCIRSCGWCTLSLSLNAHDQQALVRDFVMGAGKDYSVLIVSYELFRKHTDALSQLNNLLLICDEGTWMHGQRIEGWCGGFAEGRGHIRFCV